MRLLTLRRPDGGAPGVALGDEILDLREAAGAIASAQLVPDSVRGILQSGSTALDLLRGIADEVATRPSLGLRLREMGALLPAKTAQLLAPIPDPAILLSCGLNYREHLAEMNTPEPPTPTAFTKSIASIIGTRTPIRLPASNPDMVDWEGEFCAVIGRLCHSVSADEALSYVAGYTLINDVSARDWVAPIFSSTGIMGSILAWEHNVLGKQFPTFCPMGPALVTKDEIADPTDVRLETLLNGKIMQSASTSDLVFDVAQIIAYFSKFYQLRPGDVISTGSPAGVGYGRTPKVFMRPGDTIEVRATGIGSLINPIVSA